MNLSMFNYPQTDCGRDCNYSVPATKYERKRGNKNDYYE